MDSILGLLSLISLIGIVIFLIRGLRKKPNSWRNMGVAATTFLAVIFIIRGSAPEGASVQTPTQSSQDESLTRSNDAATNIGDATGEQANPMDINEDGIVDTGQTDPNGDGVDESVVEASNNGQIDSIDANGDGIVDAGQTDSDVVVDLPANAEGQTDTSPTASEDPTSPEADSTLKSMDSNIVPVTFNNVRNVGGDRGDDLGAGLWMSAEAAGYRCTDTEAYSSPLLSGLKSDLKTDLENNGYTYEEIENLSSDSGEIIVWKAISGGNIALGFFASVGSDAGTMAICRAWSR